MNKKASVETMIFVLVSLLVVVIILVGALVKVMEVGEGIDFKREVVSYVVHYMVPLGFYSPGSVIFEFVSPYENTEISVFPKSTRVRVLSLAATASNRTNFQDYVVRTHHAPQYAITDFEGKHMGGNFYLEHGGNFIGVSETLLAKDETAIACTRHIQYETVSDFNKKNVLVVWSDEFSKEVANNLFLALGGSSGDSRVKVQSSGEEISSDINFDMILELRKTQTKDPERIFIVSPSTENFKLSCLFVSQIPTIEIAQTGRNELSLDSPIHLVIELDKDYSVKLREAIRRYYNG